MPVNQLVLVRKDLLKEIQTLRLDACLEQVAAVVALHKWRDAEVDDEDVHELLHHDLVLAIIIMVCLQFLKFVLVAATQDFAQLIV